TTSAGSSTTWRSATTTTVTCSPSTSTSSTTPAPTRPTGSSSPSSPLPSCPAPTGSPTTGSASATSTRTPRRPRRTAEPGARKPGALRLRRGVRAGDAVPGTPTPGAAALRRRPAGARGDRLLQPGRLDLGGGLPRGVRANGPEDLPDGDPPVRGRPRLRAG